MHTNHQDIRIGALVRAENSAAEYIRQLLPHGFESFELTFGQTIGNLNLELLADETQAVLADSGAVISSLGVYGNPLETDEAAEATRKSLGLLIRHARLFGCDIVAGFTGRLRGRPLDASIPRFREIWTPLAEQAGAVNLRFAFENCSMGGTWQTGDWNIAHNPAAWELMFEAVSLANLGLEWEPCHQLVSLIEPLPQLQEWSSRIFHLHGKDASIDWPRIRKYGIHAVAANTGPGHGGKQLGRLFAFHRTPGFGDSDWVKIISELRLVGYRGTIDIEGWHDPVYRDELEMTGQVHALNYLKQCRGGVYLPNPLV